MSRVGELIVSGSSFLYYTASHFAGYPSVKAHLCLVTLNSQSEGLPKVGAVHGRTSCAVPDHPLNSFLQLGMHIPYKLRALHPLLTLSRFHYFSHWGLEMDTDRPSSFNMPTAP